MAMQIQPNILEVSAKLLEFLVHFQNTPQSSF